MKTGTLGAAVVTGYLLGRFHKMKWALAIAAAAGGKRLVGKQGNVAGQATEMAKSTGLDQLTGDLRGRLVEAGKAAAVSAVSSRIDSFSEGLHSRSESLRGDGRPGRDAQDAEESSDTADDEEPEDREDEPEDREDEPEDREDEERPAGRKRRDGGRPARGDGRDRPPRRRGEDGGREAARPARRRSADGDERRAPASKRGGNR